MIIGFIGVGAMGQPMARNLAKAGFDVNAWNRTRERAEALGADGVRVATSIADAAHADVVVSMLADDRALEQVAWGDGALIAEMPRGAVHVSMSTITPAIATRLVEAHRTAGGAFVSAPVFGRPDAAAAAKLFIVAAGPSEAVERCQPMFAALGQRTFVLGEDAAAANVVKLSGNFLIASMIEALGEAFALVRKAGVDPARYLEVLTGSLFNAPVVKTYGAIIAEQRFQPAGFALPLGLKDVRLLLGAAQDERVPMPLASLVHDHLLTLLARGFDQHDWSAIAGLAAERAGL